MKIAKNTKLWSTGGCAATAQLQMAHRGHSVNFPQMKLKTEGFSAEKERTDANLTLLLWSWEAYPGSWCSTGRLFRSALPELQHGMDRAHPR